MSFLWVRIDASGSKATKIAVGPQAGVIDVDDLKKAVKRELAPKLDSFAALDLDIKDGAGISYDENREVVGLPAGHTREAPLLVALPPPSAVPSSTTTDLEALKQGPAIEAGATGVEVNWKFRPKTSPLPGASYSPMSYSPIAAISRSEPASNSEDFIFYYELVSKTVKWVNRSLMLAPSQRWHITYSGGMLGLSQGVYPKMMLPVRDAVEMDNVYRLLKTLESNIETWAELLKKDGIPTIVQAVHSGGTPPFDD